MKNPWTVESPWLDKCRVLFTPAGNKVSGRGSVPTSKQGYQLRGCRNQRAVPEILCMEYSVYDKSMDCTIPVVGKSRVQKSYTELFHTRDVYELGITMWY